MKDDQDIVPPKTGTVQDVRPVLALDRESEAFDQAGTLTNKKTGKPEEYLSYNLALKEQEDVYYVDLLGHPPYTVRVIGRPPR